MSSNVNLEVGYNLKKFEDGENRGQVWLLAGKTAAGANHDPGLIMA